MKKLISVILSCSLLIGHAFAAEFSFDKPSEEIKQKIEEAVLADGYELFCDFMAEEINTGSMEKPQKTKHNRLGASIGGCVNNNYLVSYTCDGVGAFLSGTFKKFGKYVFSFGVNGHAVYVTDEDRLISYKEAYVRGLITDKDIDEMYSCQEKLLSEGRTSNLPFTLILHTPGDIDLDGEINIYDIIDLRASIVKGGYCYFSEAKLGDCNEDGVTDIMDVVLMRSIIINS